MSTTLTVVVGAAAVATYVATSLTVTSHVKEIGPVLKVVTWPAVVIWWCVCTAAGVVLLIVTSPFHRRQPS